MIGEGGVLLESTARFVRPQQDSMTLRIKNFLVKQYIMDYPRQNFTVFGPAWMFVISFHVLSSPIYYILPLKAL